MARFEVNGKSVEGVDLLRRRHWTARLDFWPFLALYALWLLLAVPALDFTDALVILGVLSASHILAFLFTAWSVDFRAFVGHSKVNDIHAANACKVIPAKFLGSKEIVPLHKQKTVASSSASGETEEIYFDFRKQRFFYSAEKDNFFKLRYPTKDLFGHYIKGTGYGTEAKINTAMDKWGRNIFEYPQPTFQKLMKEQCMEPFFVFQVFCVGLWCLDEYWYYSLFTLFMLFLFESTMAKNRLKTLTELRRVTLGGARGSSKRRRERRRRLPLHLAVAGDHGPLTYRPAPALWRSLFESPSRAASISLLPRAKASPKRCPARRRAGQALPLDVVCVSWLCNWNNL